MSKQNTIEERFNKAFPQEMVDVITPAYNAFKLCPPPEYILAFIKKEKEDLVREMVEKLDEEINMWHARGSMDCHFYDSRNEARRIIKDIAKSKGINP